MEGELQRALGRNLRDYRKQQGLTQEELAEAWSYTRGYISDLELGKRNVSLRTVEYLAALVDTTPLSLLA